MKKRVFLFCVIVYNFSYSQISTDSIQSIVVSAKAPISKEKISKKQLEKINLGQDIPILLKNNVSVVSTSDAGMGIGYTSLRIRGNDQTNINVSINGIPINNAESQGPFWINMPDISSSVSSITIQRGVGTSGAGLGSFGAAINIDMQKPSNKSFFQIDQSAGSFKTHKHTFSVGTGSFFNNLLRIEGRISFIKSDGYIDRASSDLFSYYVNALYEKKKTSIGVLFFGGKEKTYQAWNGIDGETLKKNRTFNSCGAIYDTEGNVTGYYNNETDNYDQKHYILSLQQIFSERWRLKTSVFYTKGKGYYEEYKQNSRLSDYKLEDLIIGTEVIANTDLIRRQWMENDFYGIINRLITNLGSWNLEMGAGGNVYKGYHYGRVIWARYFPNGEQGHEYYGNKATKSDLNAYLKILYKLDNWEFFGDVQYKHIHYRGKDLPGGGSMYKYGKAVRFKENYDFINPKVGATYKINKGDIYFTYGIEQREPNRDDILNNEKVKPEFLHNVEIGVQQTLSKFFYSANVYGMYYIDQLVLSGRIDDVGSFIRENSGKSYRLGMELATKYSFSPKLNIQANSSFSINKNINFKSTTQTIHGEIFKDYGTTTIAYSPTYIGNLMFEWTPEKNIFIKFINQYVSYQYLTNENYSNSKLKGYYTSDVLIEYFPHIFKLKEFSIKLLLNNIFDSYYESNGYYNGGKIYYYPQAGFNLLTGISLRF